MVRSHGWWLLAAVGLVLATLLLQGATDAPPPATEPASEVAPTEPTPNPRARPTGDQDQTARPSEDQTAPTSQDQTARLDQDQTAPTSQPQTARLDQDQTAPTSQDQTAPRSQPQTAQPDQGQTTLPGQDQVAQRDHDDDHRRRWRRRYRNRYPGPIPTPAEWEPPEGPIRIGLQAGHWRADEAPSELSGLRDNGTRWGSLAEWEANLEIVRRTGAMLEELGYVVDILPAVVPPSYHAHLFVAIHADGSADPDATGFRVGSPRRDATGRARGLEEILARSYGAATGLRQLPSATRRMRNYYAFNFRRYEHALHPMTIAVILETGFLTSQRDRGVIVEDPARAARGIVEAITAFPVTAMPPRPAAGS